MAVEEGFLISGKSYATVTASSLYPTPSVRTATTSSKWTAFCKNIGASLLIEFPQQYFTKPREPPKIVLDRSFSLALIRCAVHFLPIACTAVLGYLNLTGYFVGDQINGGASARARDTLLLQIAAKVMVKSMLLNSSANAILIPQQELCVVASLTSIVIDVVRQQALSKDGVPLGLLSSGFRFSQVSYLWSPQYLVSSQGIRSFGRRLFMMVLLALCGLTAVFSGPASALLLIPGVRYHWPAGATDFWLIGTNETLWPDRLTIKNIGGDLCLQPTEGMAQTAPLNMSGCIWHGYSQLAQGLKDRHFDWSSNITINDGVVKRRFVRQQFIASGTESWALGVHVATGALSRVIADEWSWATRNASSAQGNGRNVNLKNATDGQGVAKVQTWLPTARTACLNYVDIPDTGLLDLGASLPFVRFFVLIMLQFAMLPEFAAYNYSASALRVDILDSSNISAQWVSVPKPTADNHLSAALLVRIPRGFGDGGKASTAAVFACSVDARWAMGTNVATGLPNTDNLVINGELRTTRTPTFSLSFSTHAFLPASGPDWRFVDLDLDWLNTLTSSLSTDSSGLTTLAKTFTYAGSDNSTPCDRMGDLGRHH